MGKRFAAGFAFFFVIVGTAVGNSPSTVEEIIRAQAPKDAFTDAVFLKKPATVVEPTGEELVAKKVWSKSLEFGLNGSEGNTRVTNLRAGGDLKYETADNVFTSDFNYALSYQQGVRAQHRAIWNMRDEIPLDGTDWNLFGSSILEYDEFRAVDFRLGIYAGLGYKMIDTKTTTMNWRVGAGASREWGGDTTRWIPEMVLGWNFEHQFDERQRFLVGADAYPSLERWGYWRLRARAAYEVLLCPSWGGLTLRLGIQDRYDSHPSGSKRNDFDYFTTLILKF